MHVPQFILNSYLSGLVCSWHPLASLGQTVPASRGRFNSQAQFLNSTMQILSKRGVACNKLQRHFVL